tara:strand:- start:4268 stop:5683 length:1416 start_codon:yes stop_codon:yes gene_type:complete
MGNILYGESVATDAEYQENYESVVYDSDSESSYDMIVYGAYGFTGKIATEYIFSEYSKTTKVAISGRNLKKLQELNNTFGKAFDILLCNSEKYDDCKELVNRLNPAGCVLNLAGPYSKGSGGSNLIQACVEGKRNYCDISGEVDWCRQNISNFHDRAKEAGVRIVQFCAHDSLFFSIVVQKIAQKMKETYGEELETIELYDEIKSKPSKGTITTAMHIHKMRNKIQSKCGLDPLLYDGDHKYTTINNNVRKITPLRENKPHLASYLLPFFMANVNYSCVKRDNVFLKYGKDLEYREGLCFHSCVDVLWFYLNQLWMYILVYTGFYKNPTKKEMMDSYLDVVGVGRSKSQEICACFSVTKDPGYIHSATSCVEVAMCMITDKDKLNNHTGVITATMLNDGPGNGVVLDRLLKHSDFEFHMLYEHSINSEHIHSDKTEYTNDVPGGDSDIEETVDSHSETESESEPDSDKKNI